MHKTAMDEALAFFGFDRTPTSKIGEESVNKLAALLTKAREDATEEAAKVTDHYVNGYAREGLTSAAAIAASIARSIRTRGSHE
jgi:phosphoribosyl-ATP pyrophosphohydrolase